MLGRRNLILFLGMFLLTAEAAFSDAPGKPKDDSSQRILQDPKTKVIFYMESDHSRIVAISPEGKILWCTPVFAPELREKRYRFGGIAFWQPGNFPLLNGTKGEDCIVTGGFVGTMLTIVISKKTGAIVGEIGE